MNTPALPPYIYGRETGPNEKVWSQAAIDAHSKACVQAGADAVKLWAITTVRPLKGRERVHTSVTLTVMASSPEQALERAKEWDDGKACWFSEPRQVGPVQADTYGSVTPANLAKMRGEEPPAPKAKAAPALSTRPLGDTQLAVLRSLKDHGKWPGGWVWGTESQTLRALEALAQRCLVDRVETDDRHYPVFTLNEHGQTALAAAGKA